MLRERTSKASIILFSTNVNFNFGKSTIGEPSTNDLNTTDWDKPTEAEQCLIGLLMDMFWKKMMC